MTVSPLDRPATRLRGARLPAPIASGLLISIVVFFVAGSAAPTPLYSTYQAGVGILGDHHDRDLRRVRDCGARRSAHCWPALRPHRPASDAVHRPHLAGGGDAHLRNPRTASASCCSAE